MKPTNMKQLKDLVLENKSLIPLKAIDHYFLMDVLTTYNEGQFIEMVRMIDEYGNHVFFQQLFTMFENQSWRSQINKYMNFVGVTIQYMKFKDLEIELPPDPGAEKYKNEIKGMMNPVYNCVVCHNVPVDVHAGFDTCDNCARTR